MKPKLLAEHVLLGKYLGHLHPRKLTNSFPFQRDYLSRNTSSNHRFAGDMLVFRGVLLSMSPFIYLFWGETKARHLSPQILPPKTKHQRQVPPFSSKRFKVKLSPIRSNGSWGFSLREGRYFNFIQWRGGTRSPGNIAHVCAFSPHKKKPNKMETHLEIPGVLWLIYISRLYHVVLSDPEPNQLTFDFLFINNRPEYIMFKKMDILPSWVRGFLPKKNATSKRWIDGRLKSRNDMGFQTPWLKTPCQICRMEWTLESGFGFGVGYPPRKLT